VTALEFVKTNNKVQEIAYIYKQTVLKPTQVDW